MRQKTQRRDELLEAIADALVAGGMAALSMRPLAARVGTSARLLIYHFQSKEALLDAALQRVRQRIVTSLHRQAEIEAPRSIAEFLRMFWQWATSPANRNCFRLLYEVDGLIMRDRSGKAFGSAKADILGWLALLEAAIGPLGRDAARSHARATFIHASLNGLLQDFLTTGDRKRTTAALELLIAAMSADGDRSTRRTPAARGAA
jgi:AcrR family transcriptional regulator